MKMCIRDRYNTDEMRQSLAIDKKLGVAFSLRDEKLRTETATQMENAIFAKALRQSREEEERKLYVAMTRAREKDVYKRQLLNRAYGYPLTKKKLQELALTLGADVPFCLETGCRLARGIGEKLTPAPHLPPCGILVIKPRYSISTKSLFQKMDAGPLQQRPDTQGMLCLLYTSRCV